MESDIVIKLQNNVSISVPDSLESYYTFVLLEQENPPDSFANFIYDFFKSSMTVIDISPEYGLYSIPAAKFIGENGRLFLYDIDENSKNHIKKSICSNNIQNCSWIDDNSLDIKDNIEKVLTESDYQIDFIKADDKFFNIFENFLEKISAFIFLNTKSKITKQQIDILENNEYICFYYIHSLNVLKPLNNYENQLNKYNNLFFCKKDKALLLSKNNLLIMPDAWQLNAAKPSKDLWIDYCQNFVYFKLFIKNWYNYLKEKGHKNFWPTHQGVLNLFAASKIINDKAAAYIYLKQSYELIDDLVSCHPTFSRLQTLTRICLELGFNKQAFEILNKLKNYFYLNEQICVEEPFLPVSQRYDNLDPCDKAGNWILSSILEQLELTRAKSSYFFSEESIQNFEILKDIGYQSPEMERRRQLVRIRSNLQKTTFPSPILFEELNDKTINTFYWNK